MPPLFFISLFLHVYVCGVCIYIYRVQRCRRVVPSLLSARRASLLLLLLLLLTPRWRVSLWLVQLCAASVESQKQLAEALGIYSQRLRIREGHDEVLGTPLPSPA